jgi:hypothetical protein
MPYTARKLITKAYYLSGIVSRQFQSVSGTQLTDGLELLNALMKMKGAQLSLIPYYQEYTFNAVSGQEKYFIDNLLEPELLTFYINDVRYSIHPVGRKDYFASPRADNVESLPDTWHYERSKGGCDIYLYFKPNENYPMMLWGKFGLDTVGADDDLLLVYDEFYIEYLRYALAEYICCEYQVQFNPQSAKKLNELKNSAKEISPRDLTTQKASFFERGPTVNYGYVNFGTGWSP